jgi:hypothetical protein
MTTPEAPEAAISTRLLMRILICLIATWSFLAGIVLVAFHGAGSGALGAGVTDRAGQRLVGAHLLLLVPVYLLIAWRPERYKSLLWLPFAGQLVLALSVGYGILAGETDFGDGILALAVGTIFVVLLGFVWVSEQRTVARLQFEAREQEMRQAARREALPPPVDELQHRG